MVKHAQAISSEIFEAGDRFREVFGYSIEAAKLYGDLKSSVLRYGYDAKTAYEKSEYVFENGTLWIQIAEKDRKEALQASRILASYLNLNGIR